MFKEFSDEAWAPPPTPKWRADELDLDPYFMRSQSFGAPLAHAGPDGTAFESDAHGLRLQLPSTARSLEIAQPLAPVAEIENFLFLRARGADFFAEHHLPPGHEGVFIVDTRYVYAELARAPGEPRRPVPIFFLPLDGRWSGPLTHVAIEPLTTLALRNEDGLVQTFDLDSLRRFTRILDQNVRLAMVLALKGDPTVADEIRRGGMPRERPFALPPRGSTAVFGTLLTGVNLDDPDRGVTQVAGRERFGFDLLPRAHALAIAPDVWDRLYVTAVMSMTVWSITTLFQATKLRDRVLEVREVLERGEDERRARDGLGPVDRTSLAYRAKRLVRENVSVFSTGLSALGAGAETMASFPLEYLSDRSGFKAARGGWWRKLIEHTFIYYRNINENVITNWKAFYLGVAILGTVDTTGVVLELLWLSPLVFPALAGMISPEMRDRVGAQFSGDDAVTNDLVASETMRNASIYWILGSYLYAGDQRSALMEIVRPEVERAFLNRGLNPHDPAHEAAVAEEIEERLERLLVERALPSRQEFFFSAPSIVRALAGQIGYRIDPAEYARSRDFDGTPPTAALARARHGVIADAFKRGRAALLADQENFSGDQTLANAERILAELQRRHEALRLMVLDPLNMNRIGREAYKVNKILTLLTTEGLVGGGLRFMDLWTPEDPKPIERLIAIKRELLARAARQRRRLPRRELVTLMRHAVANESAEVRVAFRSHQNLGRTLEARLDEVRDDWATGSLGAAVRDPRAAEYAGRAFRQSFFGLTAGRPDWLRPRAEDIERYGDAARAEALTRLRAAPAKLGLDAVDVEMEALEIIKTKVAERELNERVRDWRPRQPDWLESLRIAKAQREAILAVNQQLGPGSKLTIEDVAALAEGGTSEEGGTFREAYRRSLARQSGLYPIEEGGEADQRAVAAGAREAADHDVAQGLQHNSSWRAHVERLDPIERLRFVTHQYADAFITRYVEMTVSNSSIVPLTSPAQPGFFQKWRQTELPQRNTRLGRAVRTLLRVGDAMFDATSMRPDVLSTIKRRVPFAQDVISDTNQRLRRVLVLFGVTWWVNWYLWGVHFDLPTMLFFFGTGGLAQIAHYWVDRMLINVGVPPMTGTWSKVKYSLLVTTFTYPSYVPFFFFEKDWRLFFNGWVAGPLAAGAHACQAFLSSVF